MTPMMLIKLKSLLCGFLRDLHKTSADLDGGADICRPVQDVCMLYLHYSVRHYDCSWP